MAQKKITAELFKGRNKQWYFRFVSSNGKIVAQSEGYKRKGSAQKAVNSIATHIMDYGLLIVDIEQLKKNRFKR
jgi:uncharacterized protein YegP (UPF0339 family)